MVIQVGGGQLQMAFRSAPSQVFQHRQGCSLRHDKAEPFELTLAFCTSLETRKVVAKIALASIAHQYGVSYALSPQFDHLRQVRAASATSSLPVSIFCNKSFMDSHLRTVHQHSMISYLSAGQRKGWAVVTLFGGLTYVVQLTENYGEASSRKFSIFYDAATRKRFNPVLLANEMSLIRIALSKESVFENSQLIDAQWSPMIFSSRYSFR